MLLTQGNKSRSNSTQPTFDIGSPVLSDQLQSKDVRCWPCHTFVHPYMLRSETLDLQRARFGETETAGAGDGLPVFEPLDSALGELPDGTLNDQRGVGQQVGVAPDDQLESSHFLSLNVDAVFSLEKWTPFNRVVVDLFRTPGLLQLISHRILQRGCGLHCLLLLYLTKKKKKKHRQ